MTIDVHAPITTCLFNAPSAARYGLNFYWISAPCSNLAWWGGRTWMLRVDVQVIDFHLMVWCGLPLYDGNIVKCATWPFLVCWYHSLLHLWLCFPLFPISLTCSTCFFSLLLSGFFSSSPSPRLFSSFVLPLIFFSTFCILFSILSTRTVPLVSQL